MRFAVLGPLTVADGPETVPVAGEKQRLLLAILLSRGGDPVPVDTLVDALWGDIPPELPHKRLSWHVHRLRGGLDRADRIVRGDNGYALELDDAELDTMEFEEQCRAAEESKTAGDLTAAGEQWATALRLWRGPAYGELGEHRALRADAARLAGLRLRAVENRITVDLDLGRHDELVEELTALVAEHLVRERFRGQLMLALYRAGRKSEALDVYRDARKSLIDELGVEPGHELRELHKDILRDAPRLAPPPPKPAAPQRPRPAELPVGTTAFTGRDEDLQRLERLLDTDNPDPVVISAVTGTGGIGKSALAIRAARSLVDRFPDGQLYLNLRGATPDVARLEPAEALGRLLRSLDVDVPGAVTAADELAARFRSAVAGRRLLLLLDDAADAAQVTPLLPGDPGCAVVITSRNTLTQLDGAAFLRLDVLSSADALRLFGRLTGRPETAATAEVAELCGRMPLAICVAAARLNTDPGLPIDGLAEQLRSESQRLRQLDDGQRAVRSTFMVSYRGLDADAARMFRRLGLHEGDDLSVPTAAALAEVTEERAARLLAGLAASHLVEETAPDRYSMHDLLRLFSRERAEADDTPAEREQAVERMLHCYLATVRHALRTLGAPADVRCGLAPTELQREGRPIADPGAAFAWCAAELANLPGIVRQAGATRAPEIAAAITAAVIPVLGTMGQWQHAHSLCRTAVTAAERSGSAPHRAFAYRDSANTELFMRRNDAGLEAAQRFFEISAELGDETDQAMALHQMGTAYRALNRLDEAVEVMHKAIAICGDGADPKLETMVLINLGRVHADALRYDEAAQVLQRAAELAEKRGDFRNHSMALSNLAYVHREKRDYPQAVVIFERVLAAIRGGGLSGGIHEADVLWGLGECRHAMDRHDEAKQFWDDSAVILARLELITEDEQRAIAASDRPEMPRVLS